MFSYYNATIRVKIGHTIIPAHVEMAFCGASRFVQPWAKKDFFVTYTKETYVLPIKNCKTPKLTPKSYGYPCLMVEDLFERDLQYPDEIVEFKIVNLMPPITRLQMAYNMHFLALNGKILMNLSIKEVTYYQPNLNENDAFVTMISSDLRANAETNLTFVINTTLPVLDNLMINNLFIKDIPVQSYINNPNSTVICGENLERNSTENFNISKFKVFLYNNSFNLVNIHVIKSNIDLILANFSLQPRLYTLINYTLINVRNPNIVYTSPDRFKVVFTYEGMLSNLLWNLTDFGLNLRTIESKLEEFHVIFLHEVLFVKNLIEISFKNPVDFMYDSYFLYEFPVGISLEFAKISSFSGFDVEVLNWTITQNKLFIANPFKSKIFAKTLLKIFLSEVIFTSSLLKGFNTTVFNSFTKENAVSFVNEVVITNELVENASLFNLSIEFTSFYTASLNEINVSFCFDHTIPNDFNGTIFEITINEEFTLDSSLFSVKFNENPVEFMINQRILLLNYTNSSYENFKKNENCPVIHIKGIVNPRSIKPMNFSIRIQVMNSLREILAKGTFFIDFPLKMRNFIEKTDFLGYEPKTLNFDGVSLNISVKSPHIFKAHDLLYMKFPKALPITKDFSCFMDEIAIPCEKKDDSINEIEFIIQKELIYLNESLDFQIKGVKTPMKFYNSINPIEIKGVSNENYSMFFGFLSMNFPNLTAAKPKELFLNRSSYFLDDFSSVNFWLKIPIFIEKGMVMSFLINGSFEYQENLSKTAISLNNGLIHMLNTTENSTIFEFQEDLPENSTIQISFYQVKNPWNLNGNKLLSFGVSIKQFDPKLDVLMYEESFDNVWLCNSSCLSCENRSDFCLQCEETYYKLNSSCFKECPIGFEGVDNSSARYCIVSSIIVANETMNNTPNDSMK